MVLQADGAAETSAILRATMVDCQIRTFDVTDHAVLTQFLEVPRETFVPESIRGLAYSDAALKISGSKPGMPERRLLEPMVLARMIQLAGVKPGDQVLDVAPGTGYSTAILAGLAQKVVALESDAALEAETRANLAVAGLSAVPVFRGPLTEGVPSVAPFDVIFINGAVEADLDVLFTQLRDGGRLLTLWRPADAADHRACRAVAFEKSSGEISRRILFNATAPVLAEFRAAPAFVF